MIDNENYLICCNPIYFLFVPHASFNIKNSTYKYTSNEGNMSKLDFLVKIKVHNFFLFRA